MPDEVIPQLRKGDRNSAYWNRTSTLYKVSQEEQQPSTKAELCYLPSVITCRSNRKRPYCFYNKRCPSFLIISFKVTVEQQCVITVSLGFCCTNMIQGHCCWVVCSNINFSSNCCELPLSHFAFCSSVIVTHQCIWCFNSRTTFLLLHKNYPGHVGCLPYGSNVTDEHGWVRNMSFAHAGVCRILKKFRLMYCHT